MQRFIAPGNKAIDPYKDLPTIPMEGGAPWPEADISKRIDHWIKVFGDRIEARKRGHGGSC